jgi:RNA polymerase sigma-70 factor, ECF subfamily
MRRMNESIALVSAADADADMPHAADQGRTFEEFVAEEHVRLFGALCLVTGDRYEAEDIMQDAFVRLLERWPRVRSLEDPVGYLYRTAMNVLRHRHRRAALALRRAVALAPRGDDLAVAEDRELVLHALAEIPIDQRAALVVTALLGFSSDEAADILGARSSTVRARATRARAALRDRIGDLR